MYEPKINLSMTVLGAGLMSSQECYKNPEKNYEEHKMLITYTKGKGKFQKVVRKLITHKSRKQKTIKQGLTLGMDAYKYMLTTPLSAKLAKVWNTMNEDQKLRSHLDLIAHDRHAIDYSYEVLCD